MTKEEILNKMIEEMPFKVSPHHHPYILEAMEIHAQNQVNKTLEDVEEMIKFRIKRNWDYSPAIRKELENILTKLKAPKL